MGSYHFSFEEERQKAQKRPQGKLPEFIFIDEGEEKQELPHRKSSFPYEEISRLKGVKYPFFLRMFSLFASILALLWAWGALLCTLGLGAVALITVGQWKEVNELIPIYWKVLKRAMVFFIGCLVGVFSPTLGFGFVLLYFMLRGETMNRNSMFEKIISRSLHQ
jgi:hypothetical protein